MSSVIHVHDFAIRLRAAVLHRILSGFLFVVAGFASRAQVLKEALNFWPSLRVELVPLASSAILAFGLLLVSHELLIERHYVHRSFSKLVDLLNSSLCLFTLDLTLNFVTFGRADVGEGALFTIFDPVEAPAAEVAVHYVLLGLVLLLRAEHIFKENVLRR